MNPTGMGCGPSPMDYTHIDEGRLLLRAPRDRTATTWASCSSGPSKASRPAAMRDSSRHGRRGSRRRAHPTETRLAGVGGPWRTVALTARRKAKVFGMRNRRSNQDIADACRHQEGTVKRKLKHILRQNRAVNRAQASPGRSAELTITPGREGVC